MDRFERLPEARRVQASISIGVVTFPKPPVSMDDVMREADLLMYAAKNAGKRRVRHAIVQSHEPPVAASPPTVTG